MKDADIKVFTLLLFSFLAIQLLGVYTGISLYNTQAVEQMPTDQSLIWFATAFLIATSLMLLGLRFFKGKKFFGLLFVMIIFVGSQAVFSAFFSEIVAIVLAAIIVLIKYAKQNSITHNFAIGISIAGIGAQLGLMLPVKTVLILFVLMSAYDIYAVYGSKHMIKMFKGLSKRGVLLSLAIPEKKTHLSKSMHKVKPGKGSGFIMLGTGDIAFPLILAVSALEFGITSSLMVVMGSIFGILSVYLILTNKRKPLPALPPMAFFSTLGLLISLLFLI